MGDKEKWERRHLLVAIIGVILTFGSLIVGISGSPKQETIATSEVTSKPVTTPTHEITSTQEPAPTRETTSEQDSKWLETYSTDISTIMSDIKNVNDAIGSQDFTSLSMYSNRLYKDSQEAEENSASYDVSISLKNAKDEHEVSLPAAKKRAFYINKYANDMIFGNKIAAREDLETSAQYIDPFFDHATKAFDLVKDYKNSI